MYRIWSSAVLKKNKNPTQIRAANARCLPQNRQKTETFSRAFAVDAVRRVARVSLPARTMNALRLEDTTSTRGDVFE
jgi:hypothetical protein